MSQELENNMPQENIEDDDMATPEDIKQAMDESKKIKLPFEEALEREEKERLSRLGNEDEGDEKLAA